MIIHRPLGYLLLALTTFGCAGSQPSAAEPTNVRAARAAWAAQELDSYRFDFERQCFCVREAVEPVTVEVRNGEVVDVRSRNTGAAMPMSEAVPWYTIEDLLQQIETAKAEGGQDVRVQYHRMGYPLEIEIGSLAADAGIRYSVANLEPIADGGQNAGAAR